MKGDALTIRWEKGLFHVVEDNEGTCSRCGEGIIWAKTRKEKNMPLNILCDEDGAYRSHYDTCEARERKQEQA